jgi:transposase
MKQEKLNTVGIDVSARELVVKWAKSGHPQPGILVFENTSAGHKKLVKKITHGQTKVRVCMEATGIYHFELAVYLSKQTAIEVMVVNPRAIKHYAMASMKRAKTDAVDAETILQYVEHMNFRSWTAPNDSELKLRALSRRMHQLKEEVTRERNRQHVTDYSDLLGKTIRRYIAVNQRHLEKRIELLEKKALEVIKSDSSLKYRFDLLVSIKGIANKSAIQILAELISLPEDMSAAQWVAYAGLDPRPVESGSSVNKPRRITKSGNKYLRCALYMPAWVAVQSEPHVKAFYIKLIGAGKKPLQAIVAVMRKLLRAIWGIFHTQSPWQGEKFYSM